MPPYYYTGNSRAQILHCRLRLKCSNLKYHLFLRNVIDSPLCACGEIENNHHFLLECNFHSNSRRSLLSNLRQITNNITVDTLLFGDNLLHDTDNTDIFFLVPKYIIDSGRFSTSIPLSNIAQIPTPKYSHASDINKLYLLLLLNSWRVILPVFCDRCKKCIILPVKH